MGTPLDMIQEILLLEGGSNSPIEHNRAYTKRIFNITLRSVSYRYSYPLERSRSTDLETSRFLFKQNCNF